MIDGLVAGRIHGKPTKKLGQNSRAFVIAKVLAPHAEGDATIVNIITFVDRVGDELLRLDEGDSIALSGSLVPKVWTDKQGMVRASLDMVAHALLLPKSAPT